MDIDQIRREYGSLPLNETDIGEHPIEFFEKWLNDAIDKNFPDPTAFNLSTVDENGLPDARIVLLKGILNGQFLFFTHYLSPKALQIDRCPKVAMNFYWAGFSRQVRIKGGIKKASRQETERYFSSRPIESQISTIISHQSKSISSRAELENAYHVLKTKVLTDKSLLICPKDWGGYLIEPTEIEFFQGRDNRLHDRILCQYKGQSSWLLSRLSP